MKRYQFPLPRAVLGCAAVALTALTLGVWVVAPTAFAPCPDEVPMLRVALQQPAAIDSSPVRIERMEVVAKRQPTLAATLVRHLQPLWVKHKQQS